MRLEGELTKSQILEDYLNLVSFGNNAFGIEVAAERYFNKTMSQLTLPESALLAGLVQAPSALDPITHPQAAARRRRPGARRRWSRRTRSRPQQADDAERGAAADADLLSRGRRSAATTSTRCSTSSRTRIRTSRRIPPTCSAATAPRRSGCSTRAA